MIVGRGTYLPELQSQIDIAGVGNLIEVPGYLPDDDLRAVIHRAGCVVIPSLYEPFGVVALEALAGGAPLIVADTGGLAELVGGTGRRCCSNQATPTTSPTASSACSPTRIWRRRWSSAARRSCRRPIHGTRSRSAR